MLKIPKYKTLFFVSDILILFVSFIITDIIIKQYHKKDVIEFLEPLNVVLLLISIAILYLFIFQYNGLYKINIILVRAAHLTAVFKSIFYGFITIIVISFLIKVTSILDSRLAFFIFTVTVLLLLYLVRIEVLSRLYTKLKNKQLKRNVLIVGGGKAGKLIATKLLFENSIGINIIGFVDDHKELGEEIIGSKRVLGKIEEIPDIVESNRIDEILIVMDNVSYDRMLEILDICKQMEVTVRVTSELFDIVAQKVQTEKYVDIPLVDVSSRINYRFNIVLKRMFDIIASVMGLIALSPIFLTIAMFIKVTSFGPIFFYQTRIGKDGKPFKFYKFRSMYVNGGEDEERKKMMLEFMKESQTRDNSTKVINAKRVTKVGRIIRKTSLDELPQLFNVLKGDMSLVGPRPCLPYEYENYANWQKRRVGVLPGCTGVWQVTGRSSVSFKDSIVLDLYYINNMSPWLDLQILIKTIPVMFFARGGK
ncbi:MAG TPA: sugar transferase [Ignavibacteriaceae bacterium]|nr:sugar transferase [Ignavibacteriaceae bacterium]